MNKCTKCNGTGEYQHFGRCFKCNGTGKAGVVRSSKTSKYNVGDTIQSNSSKRIFTIIEITSKYYKMNTRNQLGRHIDNYKEDSKEGYTLISKGGN